MKRFGFDIQLSKPGVRLAAKRRRDHYARLLKEQASKCAICHAEYTEGRAFHVDHCHTTDKVRGLLCRPCNQMLGFARDNPWILVNGAIYLKKHRDAV
mgnify:CR=1 FL=1